MTDILEMRGISKSFGAVRALSDVSFTVRTGEIHALVGENGAGKSTLMKILSGVYPQGSYEGSILFEGQERHFRGINDSEALGIIIIHQELALIPLMSIAENIFLVKPPSTFGIIDRGAVYRRTAELLAKVGLGENPDTLITNIGVGKQQLVEIAKALSKDVRLLILDEPTASLNERDSQALLDLLVEFRAHGISSILISHKLNEISKVADQITVLRDGRAIETMDCSVGPIQEDAIIRKMVDRDLASRFPSRTPAIGAEIFRVERWTVHHPQHALRQMVKGVDFHVRRGEIVGPIQEDAIIRKMVDRDLASRFPSRTPAIGAEIFRVEKWTVHHPQHALRQMVKGVDFHVRRGEIVGIAGLMGAGRTEFAMSIFGRSYGQNISGSATLDGAPVDLSSVPRAIAAGLAYVTEDRKHLGLLLGSDIRQNISLANLPAVSSAAVIDDIKELSVANSYRDAMRIRSQNVYQETGTLSGGNQQKVILSKWLFSGPKVLILDEPTRGIDVGAKYEIYQIINELADSGKGVIMISSEMPELLGMCDRIYVMNEGAFVAEFEGAEATQEKIMRSIVRSGDRA